MPDRHWSVYAISNTANSKLYIGQTGSSIKERWKQHRSNAMNVHGSCIYLYRAMRKYGIINFMIEPIETSLTASQADDLECERIITLDTTNRLFGYNAVGGGAETSRQAAALSVAKRRATGNFNGDGNRLAMWWRTATEAQKLAAREKNQATQHTSAEAGRRWWVDLTDEQRKAHTDAAKVGRFRKKNGRDWDPVIDG